MLPRRRTLAGMGASARNAAKNRFQQVKDNTRQVNRSGINFINILCTAFALVDSKSVKNTVKSPMSFLRFWDLQVQKLYV